MRLSEINLAAPYFLLGLLAVPGMVGYLVYRRRKHLEPAMLFPGASLVEGLPETAWARLIHLPEVMRALSLCCFVVALARPQIMGASQAGDAEGIDIILALDTSGSMRAADFQPNDRMYVAKKSIEDFVRQRSNDRIGLVVFAGEAASWVPLTLDYSLVAQLLSEVDTNMLPDGTAIGSALGTALNRLRESDAHSKVIVLLTDGDNNAGSISPKKAAELAKELGVRVYTILIGKGGAVPFPAGKDAFGRTLYRDAVLPTNPALLEEIAKTSGGQSYVATDKDELDQGLSSVLDTLERTKLEASAFSTPRDELFPYLVLAGLALLALEMLLSSTRLWRYP